MMRRGNRPKWLRLQVRRPSLTLVPAARLRAAGSYAAPFRRAPTSMTISCPSDNGTSPNFAEGSPSTWMVSSEWVCVSAPRCWGVKAALSRSARLRYFLIERPLGLRHDRLQLPCFVLFGLVVLHDGVAEHDACHQISPWSVIMYLSRTLTSRSPAAQRGLAR